MSQTIKCNRCRFVRILNIANIAEKDYRFRFFCNVAIIRTCIIKESSLLFKLCLNFYLHFYLLFSFKILVVKIFLWNKKNILISLFHIHVVMLFISKTYNWCFINYFNYSMTLPTSLWMSLYIMAKEKITVGKN